MQKIAIIAQNYGGREHAIGLALQNDPHVSEIGTFMPNPGMQGLDKVRLFREIQKIDASTFVDLGRFLEWKGYDGGIVGPEQTLVDDIVGTWQKAGIEIPLFGPSGDAAQLEGSKGFAREFMREFDIPIPEYKIVEQEDFEQAARYIRRQFIDWATKIVLKADGLAGGKWVEIFDDENVAVEALQEYLSGGYGNAGKTVVIEECLEGMEFSVFVLVDGTGSYKILPVAQDHKRLLRGDKGPNTGGMGAYAHFVHPGVNHHHMMQQVERQIIQPTVSGIRMRWLDYKGVIYFGLMQTKDGPKVIEYNVRFGDPEAEVLLPLINTPFSEIIRAVTRWELDELEIDVSTDSIVGVVLAAEWYPKKPKTGAIISGIEQANQVPGVQVFHAWTTQDPDGKIVVSGGRVLVVTGRGETLREARDTTYVWVDKISFTGMQFRDDIAHHLLGQ